MAHWRVRIAMTIFLSAGTLGGCNAAPAPTSMVIHQAGASDEASRPDVKVQDSGTFRDDRPLASQSRRSRRRSRPAAGARPGDFDFYLLNLSWSPEFCATHPASPECSAHPGFVVHGLWPQNSDGTYPESCSDAPGPADPEALTGVIPTAGLVTHEWATHGTCSGLSSEVYFTAVRRAFQEVKIPASFTAPGPPAMLSADAILAQFMQANPGFPPDSFALSCGHNYLTAVEICMDKSLHPEACRSVRSCGANAVRITPRQ